MSGRPRTPIGSHGRVQLQQLPSGNWQARAWLRTNDGTLKPVKRTGATKVKAENRLKAALLKMNVAHGDISPDTSVSAVIERWLADLPGRRLKDSTREKYNYIGRTVLLPTLTNLKVREMSPGRVYDWLASLPKNHKAARAALSGVMDLAVRADAIAVNPVKNAPTYTPPRQRADDRKNAPRALDPEHLAAVRYALTAWENEPDKLGNIKRRTIPLRHIMMMQLVIAGRINETLALRWCDIDFDASTVHVTGAIESVSGPRVRGATKSVASERAVVVPEAVMAMLRSRLHDAREEAGGRLDPTSPVFASSKGTWLWHNNVERAWREARALGPEGVDMSWIVPHTLRKTAGTTIADALGVLSGAKLLGHADTRTFESFYLDKTIEANNVADLTRGLVDGF